MKIYELNKKNRFIFLLKICCLVFCLGMLFCTNAAAASNSVYNRATYQKAVSYYKKGKFSKANKYFKMLKKNANESCVKKMPKAMKKAYLEVLQSYYPERRSTYYMWNYYLTDIDKDNKPELLIRFGSCEADARLIIYSYRRQFVLKVGELSGGHSTFYYDPRGNGFTIMQAHMGYESIYSVKLKNDRLTSKMWNSREKGSGNYISLPFMLDGHATSKGGKRFDYSPLK